MCVYAYVRIYIYVICLEVIYVIIGCFFVECRDRVVRFGSKFIYWGLRLVDFKFE